MRCNVPIFLSLPVHAYRVLSNDAPLGALRPAGNKRQLLTACVLALRTGVLAMYPEVSSAEFAHSSGKLIEVAVLCRRLSICWGNARCATSSTAEWATAA